MGSVGDNFSCPLCGRKDQGGYALDTIGYPLCMICHFGPSPVVTRSNQFTAILGRNSDSKLAQIQNTGNVWMKISKFLVPNNDFTDGFLRH